MKLKIFSDGGARGNPGPAGIGAVIYDDHGQVLREISRQIGVTTNNQAEYLALLAALEAAEVIFDQTRPQPNSQSGGSREIDCYLDSELIVRQLNQEYKVKDKKLQALFLQAWNKKTRLGKVRFHHVNREQNKRADKLVNQSFYHFLLIGSLASRIWLKVFDILS